METLARSAKRCSRGGLRPISANFRANVGVSVLNIDHFGVKLPNAARNGPFFLAEVDETRANLRSFGPAFGPSSSAPCPASCVCSACALNSASFAWFGRTPRRHGFGQ